MSRSRRKAAAYRRAVRIETRAANRQVVRNLTERHPLKIGFSGWTRPAVPVVLLDGWLYEVLDRSGRVVFSERSPAYHVPYESWARAVWTRPRPLPRSLLAKVGRRR